MAITAISPNIHLRIIITISHQTLRGSIPPRRNILSVRLFRINSFTRSKISQFDGITRDEHILRLDVSMKDALAMDVLDGFEQLEHKGFYFVGVEVVIPDDEFVHVLFHELEDEG